jgi:hypothetical protein
VYLLTGPHTNQLPGLSTVGVATLADDLGWKVDEVQACWDEIEKSGMAQADWKARVIYVPSYITAEPPKNPNTVLGWASTWGLIPACALKEAAREAFLRHMQGRGKPEKGPSFEEAFRRACPAAGNGYGNGFGNGSPDGSTNHSSNDSPNGWGNQEQEQVSGTGAGAGAGTVAERAARFIGERSSDKTFNRVGRVD